MDNATTNHICKQALAYLERGWSVIPIGSNKKPLIAWKKYQTERPSRNEIISWWRESPDANIGIITGKISGLTVLDFDPRHGGSDIEFKDVVTPKVKTGGNGSHLYFNFNPKIKNGVNLLPGIDTRSEGGYVIAPPSLHVSGNKYEWALSPEDTTITDLPDFVEQWKMQPDIKEPKKKSDKSSDDGFDAIIMDGVEEGRRNDAAASYIGKLLAEFSENQWDKLALPIIQDWNKKNRPPLPDDELLSVYESIKQRQRKQSDDERSNQSLAAEIVEEILNSNIQFFHNDKKEGFSAIKGNGSEVYQIRSRPFRHYISYTVYRELGKVVSADVLNNVLQLLEARAVFDGQMYDLEVRIAYKNNAIWYDIGDGRVVHIDEKGWTISDTPPILFRRYSSQSFQVLPKPGGKIDDLYNFCNIANDDDKLLLIVYTIASFIPGFPHPILVFFGPQGAGKTTPQRLLKSLVDPSVLKTLSAPGNLPEFVQLASHHYFLFLDNMSDLRQWLSDALARAVTGDGFSKRELYSDDNDVIYCFQRVIALNGINLVVERADLLERSILIGLDRISREKRREEQEFWHTFESKKPYLLGAIFDAVSGAIREYPSIKLESRPRMADFARWGCAIAKAIGYSEKRFLDAYNRNITKQNSEAIDASPVATTIMSLMANVDTWDGTATELYENLESQAKTLKIDLKSDSWPKDPSALSRKIHVVKTNLAEEGIWITQIQSTRPKRINISKSLINPDNPDNPINATVVDDDLSESNMTASGDTVQNPVTNPVSGVQNQFDGMTGLSGFPDEEQNRVCNLCKGTEFWQRPDGVWICGICHPKS